MELTTIGIIFAVGLVAGAVIGRRIFAQELDVESAIKLLKNKGYWVKINIPPVK